MIWKDEPTHALPERAGYLPVNRGRSRILHHYAVKPTCKHVKGNTANSTNNTALPNTLPAASVPMLARLTLLQPGNKK